MFLTHCHIFQPFYILYCHNLNFVKIWPEKPLFDGCFWFKFNNLRLALGMVLKFYASVAKGSKLQFRKSWGLISMFVEVKGKNLLGRVFLTLTVLKRVKSSTMDTWYLVSQVTYLNWHQFLEMSLASSSLQQFQVKSSVNTRELNWLSMWRPPLNTLKTITPCFQLIFH